MKIEKEIPVPYCGRVDGPKWPFKEMKISDSFLIPPEAKIENVRYSIYQFINRKQKDWKFTIRQTTEGKRCWRIK